MHLKRNFITGLIVVVPVVMTIYVLVLFFQFTDNILGAFLNVHFQRWFGFYIPGVGLLLFLSIILVCGILANRFFGKKLFAIFKKWFSSIPLIKIIYPAFHQIMEFLLEHKDFGFKKVVLVEYPSKGLWSVGFITGEQFLAINEVCGREMIAVFVPNTPGPFAGYVVFVAKEEIKLLDMQVGDAIKIVISGGVVNPSSNHPQ